MRVSLAEVGRRGRMDLTFVHRRGKTILQHAYCETPFKITRPLSSEGPGAHLMLMHSTAGLFGGDAVECSIRVERGARVLLTQQSAAKIHPAGGLSALQSTHIVVESGAELQMYLDPVIPFTGSILRQSTHIDLEDGARFAYWEGFMAGRIGRGEQWQFQELSSETQVRSNGSLLYLDRFRLDSAQRASIGSRFVMSNHSYFGTGLYVSDDAAALHSTLHQEMPAAGIERLAANLILVRAVSASGPEFHRLREAFCKEAKVLSGHST